MGMDKKNGVKNSAVLKDAERPKYKIVPLKERKLEDIKPATKKAPAKKAPAKKKKK